MMSLVDSGTDLYCSQPVLILIVTVCNVQRQSAVRIAFPPPAKVDRIVNPSDLILPADAERDRVIFTITDIRKSDTPQDRSVKSPGRAQPINTERVISAILACPFAVVDNARRNL